jgi:hypothetical protein
VTGCESPEHTPWRGTSVGRLGRPGGVAAMGCRADSRVCAGLAPRQVVSGRVTRGQARAFRLACASRTPLAGSNRTL